MCSLRYSLGRLLCFAILALGPSSLSLAASSITVNIDNPSFRKLVIAVPPIAIEAGADSSIAKDLAERGHDELAELLAFSGYFNVIAEAAYGNNVTKLVAKKRAEDGNSWLKAYTELSGDDAKTWKGLNVEALTLGSVSKKGSDTVIVLKTFDPIERKEIVSKEFTGIASVRDVMRRYADFLLEAYTGKKGIFSSKLAFVGRRKKGDAKQIYISDFDGSNLQQITTGNNPHLSPAWSPDGRYIAYTSLESSSTQIFVYDTITKSKRQLTRRVGLNSGANWSPDGKYIAYTSGQGGDTDIFLIEANGSGRKLMIQGSGLDVDPKFAPDGQKIAFVSGRFGNPHIFVGKLSGNNPPRVVSDKRLTYAGWYNSTPSWSPESDKIIFGGYDKDIDRYDIFIMNPDGSKLERLTLKTGDNESPSWSPNGQLIVFQSNRIGESNRKGVPSLFMMNRDGSSQRKIDVPLYEVQTPAWSNARSFD